MSCLTPDVLDEHGLLGLLLDLDETLLPAGAAVPSEQVRAWAAALRGDGIGLAIVSNGTPERVASVGAALSVPAAALAGKPSRRAYRRGLEALDLPAHAVAMVGDQLFTDVLGAHLAGLRSVLVSPLSRGGLPHTRVLRHLERVVLRGGDHGRTVHR